MNRRKLLLGSAAVVATWPLWLQAAFGSDAPPNPVDGLATLSGAWKRAHELGKPLLVLVVPEDDGEKWTRGHLFGEWLNHGGPEAVAPLALSEVTCATMADLRRLVPAAGAGEPLAVLVETDRLPAKATQLDAEVPELPSFWTGEDVDEDKLIDQRIAGLTAAISAAIVPNDAVVAARIASVRAALPGPDLARAEDAALTGATLPVAEVDRFAAIVYGAAVRADRRRRKALLDTLAEAAASRLTTRPPTGARWATTWGCGVDIEGTDGPMVDCGMGHVSPRSSRFLYFFNDVRF